VAQASVWGFVRDCFAATCDELLGPYLAVVAPQFCQGNTLGWLLLLLEIPAGLWVMEGMEQREVCVLLYVPVLLLFWPLWG